MNTVCVLARGRTYKRGIIAFTWIGEELRASVSAPSFHLLITIVPIPSRVFTVRLANSRNPAEIDRCVPRIAAVCDDSERVSENSCKTWFLHRTCAII